MIVKVCIKNNLHLWNLHVPFLNKNINITLESFQTKYIHCTCISFTFSSIFHATVVQLESMDHKKFILMIINNIQSQFFFFLDWIIIIIF